MNVRLPVSIPRSIQVAVALGFVALMASRSNAEPIELQSIGPMTFAPGGVLLVGDPKAATLYAIETEDSQAGSKTERSVPNLTKAIAASLSLAGEVSIGELAVNPETGSAFVSVSDGKSIRLVKIDGENTISELPLDSIANTSKELANAPADAPQGRRRRNPRDSSITDLAFFDGKVMVTGLSADRAPSRVIEFEFPFSDNSVATSVEIFHAAHGRVETPAIQTFLPMMIDGEPTVLAGFTCTPLVRFPVKQLNGSEKVRGATVAELGNRNRPLDMVVYEKDGKTSILMNNSARGMMKITTDGIAERATLTERVSGGGTAGQPFDTIASLSNVKQMDKLNESQALAIVEVDQTLTLKTIELP
ncbi:MAG: hypothetical protein AAFU85_25355 [Planctomycetota bacterium]